MFPNDTGQNPRDGIEQDAAPLSSKPQSRSRQMAPGGKKIIILGRERINGDIIAQFQQKRPLRF
jgi:hypothetical protein